MLIKVKKAKNWYSFEKAEKPTRNKHKTKLIKIGWFGWLFIWLNFDWKLKCSWKDAAPLGGLD